MDDKNAYISKIEAQLDEWRAEIDKMQAKAKGASADARMKWQKEVDDLRAMQKEAEVKLDKLKAEQSAAWTNFKSDVEASWERLGKAVRSSVNEFS
jgi:F0F1-type ATP synthase membrane subunit b/b'